jgi:hypothetical protein
VRRARAAVKAVEAVGEYEQYVDKAERSKARLKRRLAKAKIEAAAATAAVTIFRAGPRELRNLPDRTKRRNKRDASGVSSSEEMSDSDSSGESVQPRALLFSPLPSNSALQSEPLLALQSEGPLLALQSEGPPMPTEPPPLRAEEPIIIAPPNKRRKLGKVKRKLSNSGYIIESDQPDTPFRLQLQHDGQMKLDSCQHEVANLPLHNKGSQMGRLSWALYVLANRLSNKFELTTSLALASELFFVPERTLAANWYKWKTNDDAFLYSLRGAHPKTQWLLSDVAFQLLAKAYIRENAPKKPPDRFTPAKFATWLNEHEMNPRKTESSSAIHPIARCSTSQALCKSS